MRNPKNDKERGMSNLEAPGSLALIQNRGTYRWKKSSMILRSLSKSLQPGLSPLQSEKLREKTTEAL